MSATEAFAFLAAQPTTIAFNALQAGLSAQLGERVDFHSLRAALDSLLGSGELERQTVVFRGVEHDRFQPTGARRPHLHPSMHTLGRRGR